MTHGMASNGNENLRAQRRGVPGVSYRGNTSERTKFGNTNQYLVISGKFMDEILVFFCREASKLLFCAIKLPQSLKKLIESGWIRG